MDRKSGLIPHNAANKEIVDLSLSESGQSLTHLRLKRRTLPPVDSVGTELLSEEEPLSWFSLASLDAMFSSCTRFLQV